MTDTRPILRSFQSLRGRLVLLVLFATAPAIFFIFYIAVEQREAALRRLSDEARHLAGLASREHAHQLEGAKNLLGRLGPAVACHRWGAARRDRDSAGIACPDHLSTLLSGYPQFANIGVLSREGAVVCSAVEFREPHDWKGNPAFRRALTSAGVEVGSYVVGTIVQRPVLHLALAMRDAQGTPCAVAFVALDLRWIDGFARQANLPRDNSLLITDREGRVLARSGAVEAAEPSPSAPLRVPDFDVLLKRAGGAVLTIGEPTVPRLFVAAPTDGLSGVFVVAGLPNERVQSEVNAVFFRALLGLLLITLLTLTAAVLAAEFSVLRVLRNLSGTARRFGAGDLNARASLTRTHGELRELAASFNVMADALAERQREAVAAETQLRALSNRLQVARDDEAARIARELHDELGQVLTSLKLDLATFEKWHEQRRATVDVKEVVGGMGERIDAAIDFVRRLASELRPVVLDRLGLSAAIQGLARSIEEKSGLAVVVDIRDVKEPVDPRVSIVLFRIAQEALTNVVRHAAATEVRIDLAGTNGGLWLTIEDNGKGVDAVSVTGGKSLGIVGMRERARLVGGVLTVSDGEAGRGTKVQVGVPRRPPEIVEAES